MPISGLHSAAGLGAATGGDAGGGCTLALLGVGVGAARGSSLGALVL